MTEESNGARAVQWNQTPSNTDDGTSKLVIRNSLSSINNKEDGHEISQLLQQKSSQSLNSNRKSKVILNVGGIRHEGHLKRTFRKTTSIVDIHLVLWQTLSHYPETRLGRLARLARSIARSSDSNVFAELKSLCDDFDLANDEFYFDRSPRSFTPVIDFYRTGKLHFIDDICVIAFYDDLIYWGLNENYLDICCLNKYHERKEFILDEMKKEMEILQLKKESIIVKRCFADVRRKLWTLFEMPHSSPTARLINMINIGFILLSSMTLTLSTIEGIGCIQNKVQNVTNNADSSSNAGECHEPLSIFVIEVLCVVWFTIDYCIRLFAAPSKGKFFKSVMNTIDLIAIVPFYISMLLETFFIGQIGDLKSVRKATEVFRVLRIMRILKLARHSTGLQSLGFTLKRSYKELSMLLMFLGIFILLFSSLIYFAEKDINGLLFRSIPHSFWWASITMTTVGYGDMYPISVAGKLIGSVCAICGVLVIALPIPIIVNNFSEFYQEQLRREKAIKRQQWMELEQQHRSNISLDQPEKCPSTLTNDVENNFDQKKFPPASIVEHCQTNSSLLKTIDTENNDHEIGTPLLKV